MKEHESKCLLSEISVFVVPMLEQNRLLKSAVENLTVKQKKRDSFVSHKKIGGKKESVECFGNAFEWKAF